MAERLQSAVEGGERLERAAAHLLSATRRLPTFMVAAAPQQSCLQVAVKTKKAVVKRIKTNRVKSAPFTFSVGRQKYRARLHIVAAKRRLREREHRMSRFFFRLSRAQPRCPQTLFCVLRQALAPAAAVESAQKVRLHSSEKRRRRRPSMTSGSPIAAAEAVDDDAMMNTRRDRRPPARSCQRAHSNFAGA